MTARLVGLLAVLALVLNATPLLLAQNADSDATDSDVNIANGISNCITLAAGQNDPNWAAGINQPPVTGNNCIGDLCGRM